MDECDAFGRPWIRQGDAWKLVHQGAVMARQYSDLKTVAPVCAAPECLVLPRRRDGNCPCGSAHGRDRFLRPRSAAVSTWWEPLAVIRDVALGAIGGRQSPHGDRCPRTASNHLSSDGISTRAATPSAGALKFLIRFRFVLREYMSEPGCLIPIDCRRPIHSVRLAHGNLVSSPGYHPCTKPRAAPSTTIHCREASRP